MTPAPRVGSCCCPRRGSVKGCGLRRGVLGGCSARFPVAEIPGEKARRQKCCWRDIMPPWCQQLDVLPPWLSSPLAPQPWVFLSQGAADLQHQSPRLPDRPGHQAELDPGQQARFDRLLFLRCHTQRVPHHQRGGHQGRGHLLAAPRSSRQAPLQPGPLLGSVALASGWSVLSTGTVASSLQGAESKPLPPCSGVLSVRHQNLS